MKKKRSLKSILMATRQRFADFQEKMHKLKHRREEKMADTRLVTPVAAAHEKKVVIEVSSGTVARITAVVLLLVLSFYFIYQISGILLLLFVAFLLAAALDPIIDFLQTKKVPRGLSVLLIYFLILFVVGALISSLIPLLAKQVVDIARTVGDIVQKLTTNKDLSQIPFSAELRPYLDQLYQTVDVKTAATQIQSTLQLLATQLLNISFGLVNVVLVLVLTFFMTVEEKAMEDFFLSLFPSRYGHYISTRIDAVKEKIGYWLRGQLLLSLISAVVTYIGLLILGVDYALTLAVIAGIMMVIPVIGRVFAWIFALPVVFNQSPLLALWMSAFYFILQQVELNIFVPYIMNRAVGLSPIIITFAMLVGAQYLGILGLVIAIPIATTVAIFVKDYMERSK